MGRQSAEQKRQKKPSSFAVKADTTQGCLNAPQGAMPVFESTGPTGHRKRMRQRVLAQGAASLADYELLEMLLYVGIPRKDTKPLAKSLINTFGTLQAVLEAGEENLRQISGVTRASVAVLQDVACVADRLPESGEESRQFLGNWDSILEYADVYLANAPRGQVRALFLDSRNQLIADETVPAFLHEGSSHEAMACIRQAVALVLQRALALHACALVTVDLVAENQTLDQSLAQNAPFVRELQRSAPLLAVEVHDHITIGWGEWRSFNHHAGPKF
ncbi:JAB domain-containing protein [Acetobacter oryzifermentans]|uniref:DNA repair protein RadC n=1 Tax=Acetobacter oryzifermentans TaxID=1633874 RepID=A0ABN4NNU8_9PROT|nr:DNA repair protein RadC [Acetobacter oryzifermentans]